MIDLRRSEYGTVRFLRSPPPRALPISLSQIAHYFGILLIIFRDAVERAQRGFRRRETRMRLLIVGTAVASQAKCARQRTQRRRLDHERAEDDAEGDEDDTVARAQIEGHADATYRLLSTIPWTDELKNVPLYARGHHELLDGSGYPRHLRAEDIPVQTRILTLCDIYDALTHADRPYKRALSRSQALAVMQNEATAGRLGEDLLRIMTAWP